MNRKHRVFCTIIAQNKDYAYTVSNILQLKINTGREKPALLR